MIGRGCWMRSSRSPKINLVKIRGHINFINLAVQHRDSPPASTVESLSNAITFNLKPGLDYNLFITKIGATFSIIFPKYDR
jgi:hypothetical protein